MDQIVIYPSWWKTGLAFLGSVGFVAVSCFLLIVGNNRFSPVLIFPIAGLGIAFFGACMIYTGYRWLSPSPALVIGVDGIYDNASATGAGQVMWQEIREVYLYKVMGNKMIGIVPVDTQAIIARQGGFKKFLISVNSGMGFAPINIPQAGLSVPVEKLLAQIIEFWEAQSEQANSSHPKSRFDR
jgi:hypothetical protein